MLPTKRPYHRKTAMVIASLYAILILFDILSAPLPCPHIHKATTLYYGNRTPSCHFTAPPETLSILVASVEVLAGDLNIHLELQQQDPLIPAIWTATLTEKDILRIFTVFQLMTTLEKNHHSLLIVRARSATIRGCRRNGRVPGPGPEADLQGGHRSAQMACSPHPPAEA